MMKKFRSDFPIFDTHPDLVYLDSASTSQKPQTVIDAVSTYLAQSNSNIHRGTYQIAEHSEDLYRESKARFAQFIWGSSETEVIYHYNATACFNLLAQSLVRSDYLAPGDNIILSVPEHHANIVPRQMIADQHDLEIRRLPIDEDYTLDRSALPSLVDEKTKVISLSACSNVTGDTPDLSQVRQIISDDVFFCIDASQILGKYTIDASVLGADALIGTAHKMMGLTGIGMLWMRDHRVRTLTPARGGGWAITDVTRQWYAIPSDIHGREPGTPHVVGAISLLAAMDYIDTIGWVDTISQHDQTLTTYALEKLTHIDGLHIIWSTTTEHRGGVISFTLEGTTKNSLAQYCADHQIAIRCGGHCTFPLRQDIDQTGWCRISFHIYTTIEDIDKFVEIITQLAITV